MSEGGKSTKKESRLTGKESIRVSEKHDNYGLIEESTDNATKVGRRNQFTNKPRKTKQPQKIGPSKPIK